METEYQHVTWVFLPRHSNHFWNDWIKISALNYILFCHKHDVILILKYLSSSEFLHSALKLAVAVTWEQKRQTQTTDCCSLFTLFCNKHIKTYRRAPKWEEDHDYTGSNISLVIKHSEIVCLIFTFSFYN